MAQESVRYGLRARQFSSKHSSVRNFSSEAASHPAAAATIAAGLQIGVLSKAELLAFRGRTTGYLQARSAPPAACPCLRNRCYTTHLSQSEACAISALLAELETFTELAES